MLACYYLLICTEHKVQLRLMGVSLVSQVVNDTNVNVNHQLSAVFYQMTQCEWVIVKLEV